MNSSLALFMCVLTMLLAKQRLTFSAFYFGSGMAMFVGTSFSRRCEAKLGHGVLK